MLLCQLGRAHALREITGGLSSCEGKLQHLVIGAPSCSTLTHANEHRPWQLYQEVFLHLLQRCRSQVLCEKKFRFKNPLRSLDSATIDLSITLFDRANTVGPKEGFLPWHDLLNVD